MMLPRQCAILVGGMGTRLGRLTNETPKPLLDCGGRPFLAWILRELSRFGIEEIVLLAGHKSPQIEEFARQAAGWLPKKLRIKVSIEPCPAGTGGAVWHSRQMLSDKFMLINGDSWFDVNLARFIAGAGDDNRALGHILLRTMNEAARYGSVDLRDGKIAAFHERSSDLSTALINTGMYVLKKDVLQYFSSNCSFERDVLPKLAQKGLLTGKVMEGYFIDIGIPEDYARAQKELSQRLSRPAVFFDRDGVLNENLGWVGTRDRFNWISGAKEAVRIVNDAGMHAFVVTNQAGVARGYYSEGDVQTLHRMIDDELRCYGASIDDWRYCPHHPEAIDASYRKVCDNRKPAPGMLLDIIGRWKVKLPNSFLIGDSASDIRAADSAHIASYLYSSADLSALVISALGRVA